MTHNPNKIHSLETNPEMSDRISRQTFLKDLLKIGSKIIVKHEYKLET